MGWGRGLRDCGGDGSGERTGGGEAGLLNGGKGAGWGEGGGGIQTVWGLSDCTTAVPTPVRVPSSVMKKPYKATGPWRRSIRCCLGAGTSIV